MSSLIIEVCEVQDVFDHPNADRMGVIKVKGWNICVAKDPINGTWAKKGDKVVFFPPDSVLTEEVANKFGVLKYLGQLPKDEKGIRPPGGRVKVANLRGFKSYGFCGPLDQDWEVGTDVAEYYKVTKYEPIIRANQGDAEKPHPAFHKYYDMENIRNFPDVFKDGEEVICTEKIHGMNIRLGLIRDNNDKGIVVWKWFTGTHEVNRKKYWRKRNKETGELIGDPIISVPWLCFNEKIRNLLCYLTNCGYTPEEIDNEPEVSQDSLPVNVVIFGERFGNGVQDMIYGLKEQSFRAFDITINGKYLDFDHKQNLFEKFNVETVPIVYRGPFNFSKIEELSEGPTLIFENADAKKDFREGVVVLSVKEKTVNTSSKFMDRAQLKCISFTYLNRKEGTEFH